MIQSDVMPSSTIYDTIWSGIRQSWKWAVLQTQTPVTVSWPCSSHCIQNPKTWCPLAASGIVLFILSHKKENQTFPCIILSVNVITRQPQITRTEEESDTVLLLCCLVDLDATLTCCIYASNPMFTCEMLVETKVGWIWMGIREIRCTD